MPFELQQLDLGKQKVLIQVRVPAVYRNQLAKISVDTGISMNQLILTALEATYPPEAA